MSAYPGEHHKSNIPTRKSAMIFRLKTHVLQTSRFVQNILDRSHVEHKVVPADAELKVNAELKVVGESSTALWTEIDPSERVLQLGKVQNLRTALRKLNGVQVPANEVFSFWAQLGAPTRARGYVAGRELREGCIVPSIAGGLCQLSNALYDAALQANFEILERHAHSEVVPGSVAEQGKDATIFWNYVDLRFRSSEKFSIQAWMTDEKLVVRFCADKLAEKPVVEPVKQMLAILPIVDHSSPNSCMSCGVNDCFRSPKVSILSPATRTAYLVDEYWPEFDAYINKNKTENDSLLLPIDGKKFDKANYKWTTEGFAECKQQRLFTALRSFESRSLAQQGAARQRALLKQHKQLARQYARSLSYHVTHLVVTQSLLPFLWEEGVLGGRTFDVLMTNLPMAKLHERLDGAKAMHAKSPTLGDFRASEALVNSETKALRQARRIITPHSEIAALFGDRAELLDWMMPAATKPAKRGTKIVFPASTLGRKGAFELREAALKMNLPIAIVGADLEGEDFWKGVKIERLTAENWLDDAALVVLPAFIEQKPRRLLQAVSRGVPVIASRACGLEQVSQVRSIRTGDVSALCSAIKECVLQRHSYSSH
ncbi:MAG: VanW family protein [Candidatus Melainabacteria bacterium]|nr:VanW family protein [Candidatus Melainabacteria bacterium]